MYEAIMALVLAIALETGVPPYFALAVAMTESELNPNAVGVNYDPNTGEVVSYDRGVMQLNSRYFGHIDNWRDPETNIRAGCRHLKELSQHPKIYTWWMVAVSYNCGVDRAISNPPHRSVQYADNVMALWCRMDKYAYATVRR